MMRSRGLVLFVLAVSLAVAGSLHVDSVWGAESSADFFVATNGNDRWSGRLAAPNPAGSDGPFATLGRARDAVRELKAREGGLKRDVTVLIRGGVYRLEQPLLLGPEDSGSDQHSISYAAYPSEKAVVSGGRVIRGWKRGQGQLWSVEIPEVKAGKWAFRELFMGDQRQVRARTPNEGFFRIEKYRKEDRTQFTFRAGDLKNGKNLSDVELVLFYDWEIARAFLKSVNETSNTVQFQRPVGNPGADFWAFCQFDPHQRYYLENALEFLDAPGEWYLDRHTGRLTLWPAKNEDLNRIEVTAPQTEQLLRVIGTAQEPVRNLRFLDLAFAHTDFPLSEAGYNGMQACFHTAGDRRTKAIPAAVEFQWATGCRFAGNRIRHVGTSGLWFHAGARDNQIVGNEVGDVAANGIMVGDTAGRPRDPAEVSRNNTVANNYVHNCGVDYFGCIGIWLGHTERGVVAHNEICDLPYGGISVGWTWNPSPTVCKENIIEYNHIHHVIKEMADSGGIYTLGFQPGTVLRGNLIHDVEKTHGRAPSNGMFIDEGSKGFLIEGNIIYNTPDGAVRFNQSQKDWHTFRDNTFLADSTTPQLPPEAAKAGLEPEFRPALLGK